ncbi:hypothetical protein MNBD_NITROSPINAE05-484, partial [hydrothermal vent metagenome]
MKITQKITAFALLLALCLIGPISVFAKETPAFPLGETSEWMGTYFKGKKLGFSFAKMKVTEDG